MAIRYPAPLFLLLALAATALPAAKLCAQLAPYTFSQTAGTYSSIASAGSLVAQATATSGGAGLDDSVFNVPIFPFVFNNTSYTNLYIHTNGYVAFGGAPGVSTSSPLYIGSPPFTAAVAAQAGSLKGTIRVGGTGASSGATFTVNLAGVPSLSYLAAGQPVSGTAVPAGTTISSISGNTIVLSQPLTGAATGLDVGTGRIDTTTLGAAPNRTFVVQWTGFNLNITTANTFLNFQIRLAEGGGTAMGRTVEVVYGPQQGPTTSTSGLQVGLRGGGSGAGSFNSRRDSAGVVNTGWAFTAVGNSNSSVPFSSTNGLVPTTGLTFTWTPAGPCATAPAAPTAANLTASSADVSWTAIPGVANYSIEYGPGAFVPGTGTVVAGLTGTSHTLTGLAAGTNYHVYLRSVCSAADSSPQSAPATFLTSTINDAATAALPIAVGGGCNPGQFSNVGAGQSAGEPTGTANGTVGFNSVYFKFAAPASGAVRLSTDYAGGTLTDTRLTLFSATDSSNYTTFSEIASDEDNGVVQPNNSILYATGLTPGTTYYAQVDGFSSSTTPGSFCITVDALDSTMLSTAATACATGPSPFGGNATYRGWTTLVDAAGKLVALVRQSQNGNTSPGGLSSRLTVHGGPVRREYTGSGRFYLNRNYTINWSASNADVRLFFAKSELDSLAAVDGVSVMPASLSILRQTGTACVSNFDSSAGVEENISASGSGLAGGVGWVDFTTPGFSNFYLTGGAVALALDGVDVQAEARGAVNHIRWTAAREKAGTRYHLQRSANGRDFMTIATRKAGDASYSHDDASPTAGANHYRVHSIGADGSEAFSRTVVVQHMNASAASIQAFPNPATDALHIRRALNSSAEATLIITDATGRVLRRAQMTGTDSMLDIRTLPAGVYVLRYADGARVETMKVVKD